MNAVKYGLIYLFVLLHGLTLYAGGLYPLVVPLVMFSAIPLFDWLIGTDVRDEEREAPLHNLLLRAWVPTQVALIAGTLWWVSDRPLQDVVAASVALGSLNGAGGINIAHELTHRTARLDRALAEILMTSVSYPWFCVEHVLGHHRRVGTPDDPATSRLGESVYAFLPRSIAGGFVSFLGLERSRVDRRGLRGGADRRFRYALTLSAVYLALGILGGVTMVLGFVVQSAMAVVLLEVVNYVEHYGLVRNETERGFERVQPHHSWNSNHWVTGAFLFNLPRHADHHAHAARPYWALRPWPDAPELPYGYATMVLVALVPPLWFRLMDARVAGVRARASTL